MRFRTTWCITLLALCHPLSHATALTNELPQSQNAPAPSTSPVDPSLPVGDPMFGYMPEQDFDAVEPGGPDANTNPKEKAPPPPTLGELYPVLDADTGAATPVPGPLTGTPVQIQADTQTNDGPLYTLNGRVVILYADYKIQADHATYNNETGEVHAQGHLELEGGPSDEHLMADHGVANMREHTADLFDVYGTLGVRGTPESRAKKKKDRYVFTAPNPFILKGRELVQFGPNRYRILNGMMTSCRVPDPDWDLVSSSIVVDNGIGRTRDTTFQFFHLPLFWLPYATHPVAAEQRTSGLLLPIFGNDTTKGLILGTGAYIVLGRSADATVGSYYFSKRGFGPFGAFRYKGRGLDFATLRVRTLLDRLPGDLNQGGVDAALSARHDFDGQTRAATSSEYLSSYIYRQAFEENYSAAINSEVKSNAYITHETNGLAASALFARYQNFRSDDLGDEIKVLHVPQLQLDAIDRPLGRLPVLWGGEASAAAMSRSEPGFETTHMVPRVDVYPHLALPFAGGGLHGIAQAGVRETFYGDSQQPGPPGYVPTTELSTTLNREAFIGEAEIHLPTLERDFDSPTIGKWLRGDQLRHTIEPEVSYHYVTGVHHYANTLRFDTNDALADTNEIGYGLTQHLFLRHTHPQPCKGDDALGPNDVCGGGTVDWMTWTVEARHYFDPRFGGAVQRGQRNVFDTTLDLTGTAFVAGPRSNSPVISRLRWQTTSLNDVEWDVDYDTDRGRMQSSNLFTTYHVEHYFFSFGDARLVNLQPHAETLPNAPTPAVNTNSVSTQTTFNQFHMGAGYGSPTKHGFSAGGNIGYDLVLDQTQYLGIEAGYNRDCCGLTVEMRRYSLGTVRDDTQYLYALTLANIGSIGSLPAALRVF